jgi:hypothetical protein
MMPLMLALVLATAFALPPSDDVTHFDLRLDASLSTNSGPYYVTPATAGQPEPSRTTSATVGAATASANYYPNPLVDDDGPAPLQPFLQRAAVLHLEGGGGGGAGDVGRPDGLDTAHATLSSGHADVAASAYFAPHIHLMATVGVHDDVSQYGGGKQLSTLSVPIAASFGVRFFDVLLSVGWRLTPTEFNGSSFDVPFFGNIFFDAYAVVLKHIEIDLNAQILDNGAQAGGRATWWVGRRLGIGVGVNGFKSDARTVHEQRGISTHYVAGAVSLETWFSRRFGAALSYQPSWTHTTSGIALSGETVVTHTITLSFLARPHYSPRSPY